MAERPWQCLQTGGERETFENRKGKEVGEADGETANWRGRFPRACADPNASDLADLEAVEAAALKYDVMRLCMGPELRGLHLPGFCRDNGLFWRGCRPNGLGFPANMRYRSSTVK